MRIKSRPQTNSTISYILILTSTERKEGMFATLVICLPCKHSGGDIVLEHQQTTLRINTSQRSRYSISYLAWYSDVMHTVSDAQFMIEASLLDSR